MSEPTLFDIEKSIFDLTYEITDLTIFFVGDLTKMLWDHWFRGPRLAQDDDAPKRMERAEWVEKTSLQNLKTSVVLDSIFVTITHKKNVNVRDLIWDANLALFNEIPLFSLQNMRSRFEF